MHLWYRIVLILFLFLPTVASAEILELVCVHTDGFTFNFTVDTTNNTVLSDSTSKARSVSITQTNISFVLDLPKGAHFFGISRLNGNMYIHNPSNFITTGYHCEKAIKKF